MNAIGQSSQQVQATVDAIARAFYSLIRFQGPIAAPIAPAPAAAAAKIVAPAAAKIRSVALSPQSPAMLGVIRFDATEIMPSVRPSAILPSPPKPAPRIITVKPIVTKKPPTPKKIVAPAKPKKITGVK